jgi:hypothetical protein
MEAAVGLLEVALTIIGGVSRSNLAHVKSNKTVDAGFIADCNSEVRTIVKSGSKIYFGGSFTTVNGTGRNYIASVSSNSGNTNSWAPDCNNAVYSMVLADTSFYIGGAFTKVGNINQKYFTRVGINKGKVIGGITNTNSYVQTIDQKGDTLFMGGNFTVTGYDAPNLASVSTTIDYPDINFPSADGVIYSVVPDGSGGWYVGGSFNNIGGVARQKLAHIKIGHDH